MQTLRQRLQEGWVVGVAGVVIGLIVGLVYAWGISPVRWVDGSPENLRADLRQDYLRMAIDSYSVNRDVDLAIDRYQQLGDAAAQTLTEVGQNPGEVSPTAIQNFSAVIEIFEAEAGASGGEQPQPSPQLPSATSAATRYLLPVCGATAVLGLLLAVALILRGRLAAQEESFEPDLGYDDDMAAEELGFDLGRTSPSTGTLATFRTIYTLGDDLYDDSFSVESPAGDFLGECGVGIGEVIGVGEPKKVSAFEVWLFDKNDIQTVTKVLMSRYAHSDDATRNRLAAKGDPVLAEDGAVLSLETASLQVEARIVDLKYGQGALPPESFFERITIELRAQQKAGMPAAG